MFGFPFKKKRPSEPVVEVQFEATHLSVEPAYHFLDHVNNGVVSISFPETPATETVAHLQEVLKPWDSTVIQRAEDDQTKPSNAPDSILFSNALCVPREQDIPGPEVTVEAVVARINRYPQICVQLRQIEGAIEQAVQNHGAPDALKDEVLAAIRKDLLEGQNQKVYVLSDLTGLRRFIGNQEMENLRQGVSAILANHPDELNR